MDVQVAISGDFFKAYSKLPRGIQSKVSEFISKFQSNPTSSGINYEKIRDAKDEGMHSVRIDQKYRGIIFKPNTGSLYMLVWVDDHDDAYDWAKRHKCQINPDTGSLQIYATQLLELAVDPNASVADTVVNGAFDLLKDKQLRQLGLPEEQINLVRNVVTEADLDALDGLIPTEAYEGLFYVYAGSRFDEVINERLVQESVTRDDEQIDVADYKAALKRASSRGQFVVVDDDLELQNMLNAPLQQWRVFLHPSQRQMANGVKNGPVRVLGGAGTGKTVVAMHRAKWLADNVTQNGRKVLFTTFTKNLAMDIKENLRSICSKEQMKKIEVVNLDQWVSQFLTKKNYDYTIAYDTTQEWNRALDIAPSDLGLPDSFYKEEWSRVIQPQSIVTVDQYKSASRAGRGTRINRIQRVKIWAIFEEYRTLLTRDRKKEVDDAYRDAADLLRQDNTQGMYASVVVDEAQDMGTQAFNLIRQIVPEDKNDIFIVGDGHQRIYGRNKVVLSQCGINIKGRARKLKINYRTTDEIRRWAVNLLEGFPVDDLDGGLDDQKGYKSLVHGERPQAETFSSISEQADFIVNLVKQHLENGVSLSNVCIVARVRQELDFIETALTHANIGCYRLAKLGSDAAHQGDVRLATIHRVKGLEFDEMILASLNEGIVPLKAALDGAGDPVELKQADLEERALLYVAITRAKKRALLLSYGVVSPYL